MVVGYCVKCKKKVRIENLKKIKNKKGNLMYKGKCPECNTTVCKFIKIT